MIPLGHTRTVYKTNHALITPDTHVVSPLPGWEKTRGVVQISPAMGNAKFTQLLAHLEPGSATIPSADTQRLIYLLEGELTVNKHSLGAGGYAYLPAGFEGRAVSPGNGRAIVFEKVYEPLAGEGAPSLMLGREQEVQSSAFMNDPDLQLKLLLPDVPAFDMAVNIFTYSPGAMLPQVECHVMEHGLLMLQGAGVYRLDESYYPVTANDVIWMASFCPQWFIAGGKTPSRYIYYKNINRAH